MPITKIQLRGISRVPSDRLAKDGGCAESMNVITRESEIVPMVAAESASETLAPGLSSESIDVLYIHKTNYYENYVGRTSDGINAYVYDPNDEDANEDGWVMKPIRALQANDLIESVTSIGNMLVYTISGGSTYYALYKDNEYIDLGDSIPKPDVYFFDVVQATPSSEQKEYEITTLLITYMSEKGIASSSDIEPLDFWDYVRATMTSSDEDGLAAEELYNSIFDDVWEYVDVQRVTARESNYFSAPVLARYAVRLYDGSYVHISEPILLSSSSHSHISNIKANIGLYDNNVRGKLAVSYLATTAFSVNVQMTIQGAANWGDVIESVDVFFSTDILLPGIKSELAGATQLDTRMSVTGLTFNKNDVAIKFSGNEDDTISSFEAKMLECANFYKVASYKIDDLPIFDPIKPMSQDDLVVQLRLEENESHMVLPQGSLGAFNNRIVSGAQKIILSPGHNDPHSMVTTTAQTSRYYKIFYYIRDENGGEHIVEGYSGYWASNFMRAYVAYPDPKCYKAELYYGATEEYTTVITLPMKEHPRLNCSYGFWGLGTQLDDASWNDGRTSEAAGDTPTENPSYTIDNRLALSEVDNPLVFPVEQRMRFSARIITALPATVALSTNQSGPLPIYVFTDDGIWAVSITAEGGLARSFVVSRDVAIDGTVKQLDGSIIFVSEQGVMLLSGQKVNNVSLEMDGKNFVPTVDLLGVIQTYSPNLTFTSTDMTPFLEFVKTSVPAYDYTNNRVVFFSYDYKTFQYVLELSNLSWHRLRLGGDVPRSFAVLNSYPECLVFFSDADVSRGGDIMDFSTRLEPNSTAEALPGFIVTRDLNLGGNDIYKTIKRLYIRGDRYPEESPWKYVLLGSNDRKNYHVLHSLRGPSWKFYRVAIATTMQEGGRISYIEIDWDPRYTDRIR